MSDHQAKATELFRKAAEAGNSEAQYEYACCLRDGSGVSRDYAEAANWFRKAAEAGHPEAAQALSQLEASQQPPTTTTSGLQGNHATPAPASNASQGNGGGCAMVAAIASLIFFANSCKYTVGGFLWLPGETYTNWASVIIGTAVVTVIAYFIGKNWK